MTGLIKLELWQKLTLILLKHLRHNLFKPINKHVTTDSYCKHQFKVFIRVKGNVFFCSHVYTKNLVYHFWKYSFTLRFQSKFINCRWYFNLIFYCWKLRSLMEMILLIWMIETCWLTKAADLEAHYCTPITSQWWLIGWNDNLQYSQ